jgi:hypothetical protein
MGRTSIGGTSEEVPPGTGMRCSGSVSGHAQNDARVKPWLRCLAMGQKPVHEIAEDSAGAVDTRRPGACRGTGGRSGRTSRAPVYLPVGHGRRGLWNRRQTRQNQREAVVMRLSLPIDTFLGVRGTRARARLACLSRTEIRIKIVARPIDTFLGVRGSSRAKIVARSIDTFLGVRGTRARARLACFRGEAGGVMGPSTPTHVETFSLSWRRVHA